MTVRVQTADFDVSAELAMMRAGRTDIGAVVCFVGLVREFSRAEQGVLTSPVKQLALEHYPGMTEKSLMQITQQAQARWPLQDTLIIHRVGDLQLADQIVLVAAASAHRQAAFEACAFMMDYLKTDAPFWKKEYTAEGAHWVDARESDDLAKSRW